MPDPETDRALPFVSIIIPAKNAATSIGACLDSIEDLDYPKNHLEVIVVDGLSDDGTQDIASRYGVSIIKNPKGIVVSARNAGFQQAKGDLVAFTDADCLVDRAWIKNALPYFADSKVGCVGGPNPSPPGGGAFSLAVDFVTSKRLFSAGSVQGLLLKTVKQVQSIPGCNAVYRREALQKAMPVDETLLTCDDTELNRKVIAAGYQLLYTPDVSVWHHRRSSSSALFRQLYRYGIGRLQLGKRAPGMINLVHTGVGLSLPLGMVILLGSLLISPILTAALLSTVVATLAFFAIWGLIATRSLASAALIPYVIVLVAVAWSLGFVREAVAPVRVRSQEKALQLP